MKWSLNIFKWYLIAVSTSGCPCLSDTAFLYAHDKAQKCLQNYRAAKMKADGIKLLGDFQKLAHESLWVTTMKLGVIRLKHPLSRKAMSAHSLWTSAVRLISWWVLFFSVPVNTTTYLLVCINWYFYFNAFSLCPKLCHWLACWFLSFQMLA